MFKHALPPLSLYVHIPWCIKKCPYCDFNSHASTSGIPEAKYVKALLSDFSWELPAVQGRTLKTIFFGGGTPSLMSPHGFSRLLEGLAGLVHFDDHIEITMEANPGTYEHGRFKDYRDSGINRLSLGVQSFQDDKLKALGRIHSAREAIQALESLGSMGFDNLNIDIMHGLSRQSPEDSLQDLRQAIALNPSHISWYQLTIEPNTIFYSKTPTLPQDDILWSIQEQGWKYLDKAGYQQYEVSAYCRPGLEAKHNLNYWQFGDYIGIGAGAHGKITEHDQGTIYRNWKTRMPSDYLNENKAFEAGRRKLTEKELPLEFMMNALRLNSGVPERFFPERTGSCLDALEPHRTESVRRGLLASGNCLQPTRQGRLFLNNLLEMFV